MAISIEFKPDLSRFRPATVEEIVTVLRNLVSPDGLNTPVISEANAQAAAKSLLNNFAILPR